MGWAGWAWVGVAISSGASVAGATVMFVGGVLVLTSGVGSAGAASSSLVAVVGTSCAVVVSPSLGRSTVCSVAGEGQSRNSKQEDDIW